MKTYKHYMIIIVGVLVFGLSMQISYSQGSYISTKIVVHNNNASETDEEQLIEWHPDGSVTINGDVSFTSPIKKFESQFGPYVRSDEMIMVNPNFYASRINKIYEPQPYIQVNNVAVVPKTQEARFMDPSASEGGLWYIDMKAEQGLQGKANCVVRRRVPFRWGFAHLGNNEAGNFGFEFDDDRYVIFGGEFDTNSTNYIRGFRDLEDFDRPHDHESTEYPQLFNQPHWGDLRWYGHHVGDMILLTAAIVMPYLAEGVLFESLFVEFNEARYASEALNFYKKTDNIQKLAAASPIINNPYSSTRAAASKIIKNSLFTTNYGSFANYTRASVSAGTTAMAIMNDDIEGSYNESSNSFLNIPNKYNYSEFLVPGYQNVTLSNDQTEVFYPPEFDAFRKVYKNIGPCRLPNNVSPPGWQALEPPFCVESKQEPVAVSMRIENATVRKITFPGYPEGLTPYQMFGNLAYEEESEHSISSDVTLSPLLSDDYFSESPEQALPNTILKNSSTTGIYDVTLDFEKNENGFYTFFLISDKTKEEINALLPQNDDDGNAVVKFINDLKKYSGVYNLYKIGVDKEKITLSLETNTYLAGSDIIIKKYEESSLLFVGSDTQNLLTSTALKYKDSDGIMIPTNNRPETHAVVSNAVSILDDDLVKRDAVTLATDKFGLYVGAVGKAESGILTNNAALLEVTIPDFVFEDQYNLSSLLELETFVKANKHLPYVPNQQDYKADGYYSAGQMMMGQLQNLEELYLHTFSQEEQIIALDKDTKALDKDLQHLEQLINQLKKQ